MNGIFENLRLAGLRPEELSEDVLEAIGSALTLPEQYGKHEWKRSIEQTKLPSGYSWKRVPNRGRLLKILATKNSDFATINKAKSHRLSVEEVLFGKTTNRNWKYQKALITRENKKRATIYHRRLMVASSIPLVQRVPRLLNGLLGFADVYKKASQGKADHRPMRGKISTHRKVIKKKVIEANEYLKNCLKIDRDAKQWDKKPLKTIVALTKIIANFLPGYDHKRIKRMIFEE